MIKVSKPLLNNIVTIANKRSVNLAFTTEDVTDITFTTKGIEVTFGTFPKNKSFIVHYINVVK